MISDVLHHAVLSMRRYLRGRDYDGMYAGDVRYEIVDLMDQMERMRQKLDGPPVGALPTSDQNEVQKTPNS